MRSTSCSRSTGAALVLAGLLILAQSLTAQAAPGDTTWVHTFQDEFHNWATAHVQDFPFPDLSVNHSRIIMYYRIGCPGPPGDCDPWDRLGWVRIVDATGDYEIARVITPYDITGGAYPGSCTWELDVTDYKTLLHDTVTLSSYIESWIGGERGWLVTIDFAFIEGESFFEPYRVVNLWQNNRVVYGDPDRPHEDYLQPVTIDLDPNTEMVKVRVITTGHGQGNTNNCAEFCQKHHTILAGGVPYDHILWRSDCSQNPCSPQGGTWTFPRAGWCPGDKVTPWDVDVTASVLPGASAVLDYDIQAYENLCRPNNPGCVSGVTCTDCNYNSTGHTEPHWTIQAQAVLYEEGNLVAVGGSDPAGDGAAVRLAQNVPNPVRPATTIGYDIVDGGRVRLAISDAGGRVIRVVERDHATGGSFGFHWDGRDDLGHRVPAGVYFYTLESGPARIARKMIVLQ